MRHAGRGGRGGGRGGGRDGGQDGGRGGGRGRGRRGLAKGRAARPLAQGQPTELCLIDRNQLLTNSARTTVVAIMRTRIRGAWVLWNQVEQEHRDAMYREFRSHFHFDEGVSESFRYQAWEGYHATNWCRWLNRMRSESNRLAGRPGNSEITQENKAFKPEFIDQEFWDPMVDFWSTDENFKKRSKVGREGRAKQVVSHTGGSKPFSQHYRDLENQLGRTASMLEKFKLTHSKGGGVGDWATPRCEEIANNFQQAIETQSQVDEENENGETDRSVTPRREMETWIEQSGGRKRNRVLGLGPRIRASDVCPRYPTHGSSGASASGGGPSIDEATIKRIIDEVEQRMLARQQESSNDIPRDQIRDIVFEVVYGSTDPTGGVHDSPIIIQIRADARNVAAQHFANMISTMHQASVSQNGSPGVRGSPGSNAESNNGNTTPSMH